MLNRLLEVSLRQRPAVLLATGILVAVGVWSALRLPIDAVPDITNPQVQINTAVPALAPEEIEKLVTFPVENEMAGIQGLTELRSLSKFGLSQVTLVFEEGADIYRARQLVSERLQAVLDELPPGLSPKLAPISTGLGEIYYYVVEYGAGATNQPATREAQLMELKLIHDFLIKPRLRSTPGLAEVNSSGGYDKQIVVRADPDRLKSLGMSFGELADAIGENVEIAGGGVIQLGGEQVTVRAAGRVRTTDEIANETRDILQSVRGAADVEFDALSKAPVLEIVPKRDAMSRYNIHAAEVNRVVHAALAGQQTGTLIDGNRRFPIVVRLSEERRENIEELKRLPLRVDDGGIITLGAVAEFRMVEQVAAISRELSQRRTAIMVNLRGRDVEGYVLEAQKKVAEQIKLPEGYTIEFGGQFKNLQEARARLAVVVPLALGLIFVLVFMALGSLRQTLLVYTGIPLAVTGGIFGLWLRGLPFSISAGIGFIALSGVAVLNGLMMISYFNLLREKGCALPESVREGAMTRLRPVLMTALVASLGFVPMAMASGAGAEVQRPLATVVIGGILSSTFLTLVLLPTLYEWLERKKKTADDAPVETPSSEGGPSPDAAPAPTP